LLILEKKNSESFTDGVVKSSKNWMGGGVAPIAPLTK